VIRLNEEWKELLRQYKQQHRDPRNQACHRIGIPLIAGSFPVGATVVGLPVAASMFTAGWAIQFLGHYFEGNDPSFFGDRRNLAIGLLWWLEKAGIQVAK
jgi:uncharacterized membrane protein YGL010W